MRRGRVDLGVGKAPGGFPLSTQALQTGIDPDKRLDFAEKVEALDGFISGHAGIVAMPAPAVAPERFVLGASVDSAVMAGRLGWRFVFAGQFNGDSALIERSFAAYAEHCSLAPVLSVSAFVGADQRAAEERVAGLRVFKLHLPGGQSVNLGAPEQASEYARQAGVSDYRIEETKPAVLAGTAAYVKGELDTLHRRFGIGEFVIDMPVAGEAERFAAIELLAGEAIAQPAFAS